MRTDRSYYINLNPRLPRIAVRPLPLDRTFTATRVFYNGTSTWAVNAKGELFCSKLNGGVTRSTGRYLNAMNGGRGLAVLEGFAAMGGILDEYAVSSLREHIAARHKARADGTAAEQLLEAAVKLKVKLRPETRRKLKKLASHSTD